MRSSKRDEIIDSAIALVRAQGYHRASLEAILAVSRSGKGQFYHYFRSKEDFGLALLERAWDYEFARMQEELRASRIECSDPLADVFRALDLLVEANRENPCAGGCIFGRLAQELAADHEIFRARLAAVFRRQANIFADRFADAKALGFLPSYVDENDLARFLVCLLEGGLLLMKTENSVDYLESGVRRFKEYVGLLATQGA